jgi:hypothetical protein
LFQFLPEEEGRKDCNQRTIGSVMGKRAQVAAIDENAPRNGKQKEGVTMTPQEDGVTSDKKVHWYHKVLKKRHIRIIDMSSDERQDVWYNEADSKLILAMAKVTVKMIMKDEPCDDIDYCSRGLEEKTPDGSKKRQKNKMKVRKAVLEEQDIQRDEGAINPNLLGEVSRMCSKDAVLKAHQSGLRDERCIRNYIYGADLDCLPSFPRR